MPRGFRIELLDPVGRASAAFTYNQEYVRIGADGGCELCFPDVDMAKVHALIQTVGDRFTVAPGDNLYAVLVNGGMVDRVVELRPGDIVQTGTRRLRFVPDPVPAQAAGLPSISPAAPRPAPAPPVPASAGVGGAGSPPAPGFPGPPAAAPGFPPAPPSARAPQPPLAASSARPALSKAPSAPGARVTVHAPPAHPVPVPADPGRADPDGTLAFGAQGAVPPPPAGRSDHDGTMVYGGAPSGDHRDGDGTAVLPSGGLPDAPPSSPLAPVGVPGVPTRPGRPPARGAFASPGVRFAFLLLIVAGAVALSKGKLFQPSGQTTAGPSRMTRANLPQIVGSKSGRTEQEIQANADKEYQIAIKLLEEHKLKQDNLTVSLLHLAESERLLGLLHRETPLAQQVQAKRAEALALRDEKYRNSMFRYSKLIRLGQYQDARRELEFMLRLIADPDDERYRAVETRLNRLDEQVATGR